MNEENVHDNPEAEGESSPYTTARADSDTHEALMQKIIRDRGRMIWLFFVLLFGSIYGNAYQLTLPKNVPYIHNVDNNGVVVRRILLRPDEVPPDDPHKQVFVRKALIEWVTNAKQRTRDTSFTIKSINTALRTSAGPAQVKLSTAVRSEDVAKSITRQTVEVNMPLVPVWQAGNSWRAEWEEIVTSASNMELRREKWAGTFQIDQQSRWVTELDPYGIHVVGFTWAPLSQ